MSYRDDHAALRTYHEHLTRELERLDARTAELATARAERDRVANELARVRADLDQQRARLSPIRLDNLRIASPCRASWAAMTGDERVRECARCDKQVFDLSAMTRDAAEELLATRGITACVRFYQRADGTVMTADCPVGARKQRRKLAVAAGVIAAGAGAAGIAAIARRAPPAEKVDATIVVETTAPDDEWPLDVEHESPPLHLSRGGPGSMMMGSPMPMFDPPPAKDRSAKDRSAKDRSAKGRSAPHAAKAAGKTR